MSSVTLKEVNTKDEFDAVIDCLWEAYYDPYTPFMNIMFPVFGTTEADYQKGVAESKVRLWEAHLEEPASSRWVCVVDAEAKVLSGAHWEFYEESPFINGAPVLEATWHPEGDGRDFASRTVNEIYGLRGKRLLRPFARKLS